ncbi:MAG: hypothetical protein U1F49_20675 [Rubrivivax sp.]
MQRLFKRHPAVGSLALGTFFAFVVATVVMSWSALSLLHERDEALAGWATPKRRRGCCNRWLDDGGQPAHPEAEAAKAAAAPVAAPTTPQRARLAHAEAVARSALKEQPAQPAGVLALLAHHHLERGALAEGATCWPRRRRGLQQTAAGRRPAATRAWAQARQGDNPDEAERRLRRITRRARRCGR